jgi:NAD(P)-dependent dehydrogenase (short-subunit alcohol dehydrogenase family)
VTTSVNAAVPKKGSLAYDTSKAAANHLVRELALELAPTVRVNGLAPATVVEGSSMFPRERVISSLSKYSIDYSASDGTDALREKLAAFYARRTLTGSPITLADQLKRPTCSAAAGSPRRLARSSVWTAAFKRPSCADERFTLYHLLQRHILSGDGAKGS